MSDMMSSCKLDLLCGEFYSKATNAIGEQKYASHREGPSEDERMHPTAYITISRTRIDPSDERGHDECHDA
jgi:hypothetical protein